MGIMEWLTQPATSGAAGLFNEANKHWKLRQEAVLASDERKQRQELLEVIAQCEAAVKKDKKEGNAYVLLTNALVCACDLGGVGGDERDFLTKYAAGVIHNWWTLPNNKYPITKNYDLGVHYHKKVLELIQQAERCSTKQAEERMGEYGAEYGGHAAFLANYERIKRAVLGIEEDGKAERAGLQEATDRGTGVQATAGIATDKPCPNCGCSVPDNAKFCEQCGEKVGGSEHSEGNQKTDQVPTEEDQDELWKIADRVRFYIHLDDLRMLGELLPEDQTIKALRRDYPDGGMIEVGKRVYEELVKKVADQCDAHVQHGMTSLKLQNVVEVKLCQVNLGAVGVSMTKMNSRTHVYSVHVNS